MKQPFARENLVSSSRQTTVERGLVHEYFAVDRSEGVMLTYAPKERNYRWNVALNNGARGQFNDWDDTSSSGVDIAVTSRVEVLLSGSWSQFKDFASWSKDESGLLFGAAIHYQEGETGGGSSAPNMLTSTIDLSYEANGLSVFLAGYAAHNEGNEDGASDTDSDDYGANITVAYFVVPDKTEVFARLEYLRLDPDPSSRSHVMDEDIEVLTVGVNFYQKKHNAKFTIDYVYAFDTSYDHSSSLGLKDYATQGQNAIRAQYQLVW